MSNATIVLITGANQGIGYQVARILLQDAKYHVLLGARNLDAANKAVADFMALPTTKGSVEPLIIDICDDTSVDTAAAAICSSYGKIDVLVNNAGISPQSAFAGIEANQRPSREIAREVLNTNVAGQISVTEAFLPALRKASSPRLVFVSSSTGSLTQTADPNSPRHRVGRTEYRASKAALNFVMLQYHIALKEDGVRVHGADPGLNATNLTGDVESLRGRGASDASIGGERVAKVVRGEMDDYVGRVCGEYGDEIVCTW